MTTIACDGKNLAADGRTTTGPELIHNTTNKLVLRPGLILAFTGYAAGLRPLTAWVEAGADPAQYPPGLSDGCVVWMFSRKFKTPMIQHGNVPYFVPTPWRHAIGSGREYAMGAMDMGASAQDAIKVASRHDLSTGGKITMINVREHLRRKS